MSHKIRKHLKDHENYSVYETEDGQIGFAHKNDKLKIGDPIKVEKIPQDHQLQDIKNRVGMVVEDIAWLFSKI